MLFAIACLNIHQKLFSSIKSEIILQITAIHSLEGTTDFKQPGLKLSDNNEFWK